jgi:hypothetical protein
MTDPATRPRSRLAALPALAVVVVAVWEIFAARCQATSVPGDDDWAVAARHVRAGYQPGDLIVFAPRWADPIGRLHLGDLIPVETAARMSATRYGRIWELSIRGAVAPEVVELTPVDQQLGPVDVRRYEREAPEVIFDLAASPPPGSRVDLVEVGFEPHRCLLVSTPPTRPYLYGLLTALDAAPSPARDRMLRAFDALLPELPMARAVPKAERLVGKRITIKNVPLGKQLSGAFGIADVFTRRDERRPVELVIEIAGSPTTPPISAPIDRWERFDFGLPTLHEPADVTFRLRWEANPGEVTGNKLVCVAAEAYK